MKLRTAIATATTAAVLATSGVALAGATTTAGATASARTTAAAPAAVRAHRIPLRLRLRIRRGAIKVITETIKIDRKTLRAGVVGGQTIAQIATAHGADPQDVIKALVTAANAKLDAAVQTGKLQADRVAKIEQALPDKVANFVNNWHPKRLEKAAA